MAAVMGVRSALMMGGTTTGSAGLVGDPPRRFYKLVEFVNT